MQQVTDKRLSVADRHTWHWSRFGQGVPLHGEDIAQEKVQREEKLSGTGLCLSWPAVRCGQWWSSWRPAYLTDMDFISAPIPSISLGLACHPSHIQ